MQLRWPMVMHLTTKKHPESHALSPYRPMAMGSMACVRFPPNLPEVEHPLVYSKQNHLSEQTLLFLAADLFLCV